MNRQEANRKILKELEKNIEKYPDQRFTQLLFNMNIVEHGKGSPEGYYWRDTYNKESEETLRDLRKLD